MLFRSIFDELTDHGKNRRALVGSLVAGAAVGAAATYFGMRTSKVTPPQTGKKLPESSKDKHALAAGGCMPSPNSEVPPGQYDEYYGFWSGGQSGEVRVLGIPSMRELLRIPVFNFSPYGWGITNYSKNLLRHPKTGKLPLTGDKIGRASCRERV